MAPEVASLAVDELHFDARIHEEVISMCTIQRRDIDGIDGRGFDP